jgi:hypothetical protein
MPARVPKLFRICAASGRESMSERVGEVLAFTFRRRRFRPSCAGSALTNRSNIDVACGRAGWTWHAILVTRMRATTAKRLGWQVLFLLLLGTAGPVAAQPTAHLSLTWDAPVGCPTRDEIHSRVDALLGGGSSASSVSDVQAAGEVERSASGYRLRLSLSAGDRPTIRELRADTCDELAGAAAIAIALLARSGTTSSDSTGSTDAQRTQGSTQDRASPTDSKTDKPDPPAKRPTTDPRDNPEEDAAARAGRLRLLIDAPLGVVGWGSLPSTGLGVGAAAGIRWKALRIVAGGELWRTQTLEQSGFSMRFGLQSARAEACLTQELSGVDVGPCAGIALERLSGRGIASQTFQARSATLLWVSGTGGVVAAVPIPGFSTLRILGQATVRVPTRRSRFVIDQLGPVHEPALAAPKLDFGCEWIF